MSEKTFVALARKSHVNMKFSLQLSKDKSILPFKTIIHIPQDKLKSISVQFNTNYNPAFVLFLQALQFSQGFPLFPIF
jgi:hypothetical protein